MLNSIYLLIHNVFYLVDEKYMLAKNYNACL